MISHHKRARHTLYRYYVAVNVSHFEKKLSWTNKAVQFIKFFSTVVPLRCAIFSRENVNFEGYFSIFFSNQNGIASREAI